MLAKVTSKNHITISKKIMNQLPDTPYFGMKLKGGVVIIKALVVYNIDLDKIRSKMRRLGLEPDAVRKAEGVSDDYYV